MSTPTFLFPAKIYQLRKEKQLHQKQIADALSIDTPMYCRIERGQRRAKREQVVMLANLLQTDQDELLNLWLADQVYSVVRNEENAPKVLNIVAENIVAYGQE
jgi:transcriptional regulator with XRE-family HTH domain